jgi:isoquinoline 1-oxidoreductase subunit beta
MDEEVKQGDCDEQQNTPVEEQESQGHPQKHAISRRQFLIGAVIAGGAAGTGLYIGFKVFGRHDKDGSGVPVSTAHTNSFAPDVWVRLDADNTVTIQVAKSELGQGVLTSLAMLLAEELDADWTKVQVEQALADRQFGDQKTDGSSSISDSFYTMRSSGAQARALLVLAAAQMWGVDKSTCRTDKGEVIHIPSGRRLPYGALIGVASTLSRGSLSLAASANLKQTEQFTLIGTRAPGVDTPSKIDGSAIFGLDVRLPGMRYATIARCPFLGGTLKHVDSTKASAVPGVLQVLQIESGVAVVAENTWAAIQGRQALKVTWNAGPNAQLDSSQLRKQLETEVQNLVRKSPSVTGKTVEAVYETPFLAHGTMEPMNCTAHVQTNRCEVWAPTQHPQAAQQVASTVTGLPLSAITLHVTLMGCGFGRRVETDFIIEAVQISSSIGAPVQVVWTREDDLEHDFYRPASYQQLSANLTAQGLPATWTHIAVTQDTDRGDHVTQPATDGADMPYQIATTHITGSQISSAVPVGIWRSSNYSNTIFAVESFIDEVAAAGGLDPYNLRLQLLSNNPRLRGAVQLAASKAGWGTSLPPGWGRGMASYVYFSSTAVAEVAEVSVMSDYSVRVHRVVCAVDCGLVVNPTIAEAQVEGGVVYGLTAALKGEITVANGQIQQHNFLEYPLLRMSEMPSIEVYFVPSSEPPTGLGELGVPAIAPALANAIFAATGRRIRRLPIRPANLG